ncbi:MAG: type II toxin-antitoxin system VapC family toxin [Acidobacteriota bacterium]
MSLIVDASILVDLYLSAIAVESISARIRGEVLHAPVTIDAEVVHTLRRHCLAKSVTVEQAEGALELFSRTPINRYSVESLIRRMWAMRQNITAYDAAYVALAESLNVPLITRDRRLSRSSGHAARIEYID